MNLEPALHQLRKHGLRLTPQRIEILRVLIAAERPLTAQEILHGVRAVHAHVGLDTVYRNAASLAAAGLISQVNLQTRETARFEYQGDNAHHHHLVCLGCGQAFCLEVCPEPFLRIRPDQDPGFKVVGHAFEIYGYCSGCQPAV